MTYEAKLAERRIDRACEKLRAFLEREQIIQRDRGHVRIAFAWKHDCVKLARITEEPVGQQSEGELDA